VEFTFYVSASDMNKPSEQKVIAVGNTPDKTKSSKKPVKKQQPAQTETAKFLTIPNCSTSVIPF
jgi:co-chaperonin GroES (HSP10)